MICTADQTAKVKLRAQGPKPADTTPSSQHPSSSTPASLKGPPEDQQWLQGDKGVLIKSSFPAGSSQLHLPCPSLMPGLWTAALLLLMLHLGDMQSEITTN